MRTAVKLSAAVQIQPPRVRQPRDLIHQRRDAEDLPAILAVLHLFFRTYKRLNAAVWL